MNYEDNISVIKGVGEKTQKLFNKLDINCVGDLIEYYPRDYDTFKPIVPINSVKQEEIVTIEGFITDSIKINKTIRFTILTCRIQDSTDSIKLTWFNMPYLRNQLKIGSRYIIRGKVGKKNGMLVIEQPKILSKEDYLKTVEELYNELNSSNIGLNDNEVVERLNNYGKNINNCTML